VNRSKFFLLSGPSIYSGVFILATRISPYDTEQSQGSASGDLSPSTAKGSARKKQSKSNGPARKSQHKKWTLKQHWKVASRAKQIEWIIAGVAAMAAVVGLVFWIFSLLQTKWNFEKENRSSISMIKVDMLNRPEVGQSVGFQITLANSGKMDARNAWEQAVSRVASTLTLNAPAGPNHIESGLTMPAGQPYVVQAKTAPLTQEEMDGITQGKLCIYAFGYVSYWDDFGAKQSVFCGFYKSGVTWGPQQTGVGICPHNNRILWSGTETPVSDGSHTTKCQD
jgi:hypothetical protein